MQKTVAVVLSGCGVYDGTEIQEAVLTLWALQKQGAKVQCFAPDIPQHHVVNHLTGDVTGETRNVLVESARICRGDVKPLSSYRATDYDALVFPGGFGAAKNLSSFAQDGAECQVNPDVETALKSTHAAGKPIGALCIAPAVLVRVFGNVTVTVGQDAGTISTLTDMGAHHEKTTHGEIVVDKENRLVTTPCYMLDANVPQIADGAMNMVTALLSMTNE